MTRNPLLDERDAAQRQVEQLYGRAGHFRPAQGMPMEQVLEEVVPPSPHCPFWPTLGLVALTVLAVGLTLAALIVVF